MRRTALLLPILALFLVAGPVVGEGEPFELVGVVEHSPVNEMSGIVKSETYKDVWWVQNDSGDEARIFAIDGKGKVLFPGFLAHKYYSGKPVPGKEEWPGVRLLIAANLDWEDLAIDGDRLFVADMGNNGNHRRDLGVYLVNEPNPLMTDRMRPLKFLPIRYPDQEVYPAKKWHFDCEAVFVAEGKLHFLTKHRVAGQIGQGERGTKLYRLDTEHSGRENVLTLIEKRDDLALPTAADLSPDGKRLAVLTAASLWVFEKPAEGEGWLTGAARRTDLPREKTKQAEAVSWDDDQVLRVANEQREIYTVPLTAIPEVE